MFFLIVVAALVLAAIGYLFFKRIGKQRAIRQCSYGNVEIYNLLSKPDDYTRLKKVMSEAETFADRYFISVSVSRLFPLEQLAAWVESEPDSADALLCYGARLLQWSWDARGYGRGHEVSDEQWSLFFERLEQTRDVLIRCTNERTEDPTPWAYLIMVSTWYSDEPDDREFYFEQALQRDPENWAAHMHMVIALSEKWGGDNDEMMAFAEEVAENAPEGSDLPIIMLKAYIEYWKYLDIFVDESIEALKFIKSRETKERTINAYRKSLGSNRHADCATTIFARYNASSWFWIVKHRELLETELGALGDKIEDIHWRWAGSEGELDDARAFVKNGDEFEQNIQ